MGFQKCHGDHTLFVKSLKNEFVVVLVYVDAIIIASTSLDETMQLTCDLKKCFKLRDLGALKYFLGLEIARSSDDISLCQHKYALELLTSEDMLLCRPSSVPMVPNLKLSKSDGELLDTHGTIPSLGWSSDVPYYNSTGYHFCSQQAMPILICSTLNSSSCSL